MLAGVETVVAVLGRGVVPATEPVLRGDDLGALRGDGVFETMHVGAGRPFLLTEHLDRLAASAAIMSIGLPAAADLAGLVEQACAAWPPEVEGGLRLVATRGVGPEGPPTVYAVIAPVPASSMGARATGISVLTAPLGVTAAGRTGIPWLLAGAKTLSYAVNMACVRWAAAQGADDALWVSTDGFALEGPTSTLLWLAGATLCTVPAAGTGILPGITAAHVMRQCGLRTEERMVRPGDLESADGVWFASTLRGIAAVTSLDGRPVPQSPRTMAFQALLGASAAIALNVSSVDEPGSAQ